MEQEELGHGSYGEVFKVDGKAVKSFSKVSHLIQEYVALKYLENCKYIVHTSGLDLQELKLYMVLYDSSLRKWIEDSKKDRDGVLFEEIIKIIHDILLGLIELHDRSLAHGDLKPSNILVRNNPLGAVLGDCGFVSIAKYAKVERTAAIYRDPVIDEDVPSPPYVPGVLLVAASSPCCEAEASYRS